MDWAKGAKNDDEDVAVVVVDTSAAVRLGTGFTNVEAVFTNGAKNEWEAVVAAAATGAAAVTVGRTG